MYVVKSLRENLPATDSFPPFLMSDEQEKYTFVSSECYMNVDGM